MESDIITAMLCNFKGCCKSLIFLVRQIKCLSLLLIFRLIRFTISHFQFLRTHYTGLSVKHNLYHMGGSQFDGRCYDIIIGRIRTISILQRTVAYIVIPSIIIVIVILDRKQRKFLLSRRYYIR